MRAHPAWRTRSAILDGVPVANRARGGDLPVLMVHGIGPGTTGWLNFYRLLDLLPPRCAVHLVDLAGFGLSGRLPAPPYFNVSFWLRQLDLAVDEIMAAHGRPPLLIGNSVGGALVLKLAARRPDVQQVLSIGVPWGEPTPALRAFWRAPPDLCALQAVLRPMTASQDAADPAVLNARFQPFRDAGYAAYFTEMLADPAECLRRVRLDPGEAAGIAADVTLVHGREDSACLAAPVVSGLLPLLPDADVLLFGGCGHSVCTERPEEIAKLVNHFFERAASP
jgi:pimeloyl-ACP methyl ester carboxylesterase